MCNHETIKNLNPKLGINGLIGKIMTQESIDYL